MTSTSDSIDPRALFSGSGPGARARDGCSVELYRRSRYAGEIEPLRDRLPPGTTVLELGCGTGRLTHRLLELGCEVTGVDNSAEMLAHVSDRVRRVHADIEQLALPERFDVVLLPSGLINHGDGAVRRAFIAAAARHVAPDGELILHAQDAHWLRTASAGDVMQGQDLCIHVAEVARSRDPREPLVRMTLRYEAVSPAGSLIASETRGEVWTHAFTVVALTRDSIAALLREGGFDEPEAVDAAGRWLAARPAR